MVTKNFQEHLFTCCSNLHNSLEQDLVVVDDRGELVLDFNCNAAPAFIEAYIRGDHARIAEKLEKSDRNSILYYSNTLEFSYMAIGLFENTHYAGAVILGPFLQKSLLQPWIDEIARTNSLDQALTHPLSNFYRIMSVYSLEKMRSTGNILINIVCHEFIDSTPIYNARSNSIMSSEKAEQTLDEFNHIEKSYQLEAELINAIKKGDVDEAQRIKSNSHLMQNLENYLPAEPLRSAKWLLFSVNVLYSRAILDSGVHAVTANSISRKYSKLINKASSTRELMPLSDRMLIDYCNAVNIVQTSAYSPLISKAIAFIAFNLSAPLSLKSISEYLHISPTYLSTLFKKETGVTVSRHIQNERVKEAVFLMGQHASITKIAAMVGYDDPSYFTRVFKKTTGLSPTEYAKKNKKKKPL